MRDRGLAVDEVVVILGIEDGDSMFWPAKPSMSVRDDHQLTVMTSVRPSPRSVVHIWAPKLPGVFLYALRPVLVMYSTYAVARSVLTQPRLSAPSRVPVARPEPVPYPSIRGTDPALNGFELQLGSSSPAEGFALIGTTERS